MKRTISIILLALISLVASAQTDKKKGFQGYDGGMMLHIGYLDGTIGSVGENGYHAKGITKGIGGAIRFHFGEHFRFGTEGYTSGMKQMENGSYIDTFWAGLMGDFYWELGKFMPYIGLTVGGGAVTSFLMFDGNKGDWRPETNTVFNKTGFVAINPYMGCDYIVSKSFHLTLKLDYLNGIRKGELYLPTGPRLYIGFIFFH